MGKVLNFFLKKSFYVVKAFQYVKCYHIYSAYCLRGKQLLPSLLPEVDQYLNIQRNNNGYHHSFSSFKLLELYELLIKYEPKTILELGGGASTAVFVKYAKEMHKKNVKVNIVSVDESEKYINITKSNIESIFFI